MNPKSKQLLIDNHLGEFPKGHILHEKLVNSINYLANNMLANKLVGVQPTSLMPVGAESMFHILSIKMSERIGITVYAEVARQESHSIPIEYSEIDSSKEICQYFDNLVINKIRSIVPEPSIVYGNHIDDLYTNPKLTAQQVYESLVDLILNSSEIIKNRTKRGPATCVLVNPYILDILQKSGRLDTSVASKFCEGRLETINGYIEVLLKSDWSDNSPILLVYKGASEVDAGLFLIISQLLTVDENNNYCQNYQWYERDLSKIGTISSSDYYYQIGVNSEAVSNIVDNLK